MSLAALLFVVAALVAGDVILGQPGGIPRLAFNIAYGTCGSVLATILVALTQVWFRLRELLAQGNEAVRLLGIRPSRDCRVALVVTAWETGKWREQEPVREDGKLGAHKEYPDALDDTIYVRRDVLLVADLIRLIQKAGLDAPVIISDKELLDQVNHHGCTRDLQVNTGDNTWVTVTDVVVLGLWGNVITAKLSESQYVPFRLALNDRGNQVLQIEPPDPHDPVGVQTMGPQPDERRDNRKYEKSTEGFAFIARFRFADVGVAVLGGSYGLPTARLGDLLLTRPKAAERLWEVDPESDFWAGVRTPPRSRRFGTYGLTTPHVGQGQVREHRFGDLLRARSSDIDLTGHGANLTGTDR
jgi:hypothetical protein